MAGAVALLLGASLCAAPDVAPADGPPAEERPSSLTTLSILPFTVALPADEELGERMAEELGVLLSDSGRFRILTRSQMTLEKMTQLIELQVKQGKAEERAPFQRLSCEEAFVCGSIRADADEGLIVYLYVISLASGERIMAVRAHCWHKHAFRRLARAFTREIVNRVDIEGAVVKIVGDKYFVQFETGREAVKTGDVLAVRRASQRVPGLVHEIDLGEPPPFASLVVEAITATGHVRCAPREGANEKAEKPGEGDLARLIPVLADDEHAAGAVVMPFSFTPGVEGEDTAERERFAALLRRELLVAEGTLRGMKLVNPPGTAKYCAADVDARVVCDDLGVDAALRGDCAVLGNEVRAYLELTVHPQLGATGDADDVLDSVVSKRTSVPLEAEGKLSPEVASRLAEAILKVFADDEEKQKGVPKKSA